MNLIDKYDVAPGFEDLFSFANEDEANEHEAQMIVFRFLSEVQQSMDAQGITRKELAARVNTSASYITQVFRGDKQPNFDLLARMQRALGITFNINVIENCAVVKYDMEQMTVNPVIPARPTPRQRPQGGNYPNLTDYRWPSSKNAPPAYA